MGFYDAVQRRPGWVVAAAVLAPLAATALLVPFRSSFANSAAALSLVAVVAAVAITGSRVAGILASLSAALWFDLFLTVPFDHFAISQRRDVESTIAILVVGVVITELAARTRHHSRAAAQGVRHVAMIHEIAELAVTRASETTIIDQTTADLIELLGLRDCRFDPQLVDPPLARIQARGDVVHGEISWPARTIGIPGPQAEILAQWQGRVVGRFVLTPTPGRPVSEERRIVAVALVDVAAAAIMDQRHAL